MTIDLPTIGLALFLVYLGNVFLAVLLAWSGRRSPGSWYWVIAQGLLALGTLLLVSRSWLGVRHWVPVVLGNGSFITAGLLFSHSIWAFRSEKPFPWWPYTLLLVLFVTLVFTSYQSFFWRVEIITLWTIVGSAFPAALLLWRVPQKYVLANCLTALPFVLVVLASVARLLWNLEVIPTGEFFDQSGGNELYYISALTISNMTLFGYFMMTGVRSEQDLLAKDEEIAARNRSLIESGRAKDLFFSIIAHDLRGPIGGAARYARKHLFGKMSGLEAKYNEVETLTSALEKTNEFLEKLLWWSRAQRHDWTPCRVVVDLAVTVDQMVGLFRSAAEMKDLRIEVAPGPYPQPLADPESVQLILGNLLSNAVKFSLPGRRIQITAAEVFGLCQLSVVDEGIGMDGTTLERLFRIEDKLSTHGTSGERGSGMGLLLARSLADRNRGGITIESDLGRGTKATLWLPTEKL